MSYATMYRMPIAGPLEEVKEYRNAWGGAMRIWDPLAQKWLNADNFMVWSMCNRDSKEFWALAQDERLPRADRIVLASTYDKAVVPSEMLGEFAEALREFNARHRALGDRVNHLPAWAEDAEAMAAEGSGFMDGFVGICFNQTSVADTWHVYNDEEDSRIYDTSKDEGHWPITDSIG